MKNLKLSIIPAALLLAFGGSVVHAEPIGRVLVAVGDTTALRNGVEVKLVRGAEVQTGDTLRVGAASNMQVRFTDAGITALRSNSSLRIDDYGFENKPGVDKSFFSLLKGGMRAITGLIGSHSRDNYAVKALTATIGIRGTNFVLAQCANDCFNRDGSKAEDGLFGGVTDGRIAVTNQAGEKEFGMNEFFHVTSATALPTPLLAPPSFLRDQLEGQAKSKEGKPPAGTVAAADGGATAAAPAPAPADTTQPAPQITQYVPAQQDVVQTNLGVTAGSYTYLHAFVGANAGISSFSYSGSTGSFPHSFSEAFVEQGVLTIIDPAKLAQKEDQFFAQIVTSQTPVLTFLMNAFSVSGTSDYYASYDNFGNPIGAPVGTVSFSWDKTAATNTGSNALAGNLSWGHHIETDIATFVTGPGITGSDTRHEHWATGDLVNFAALPTTGTYAYSWVGGTNPTDQNGNVGTMTNGGTVGLAFNTSGAGVTLTGTAWTMDGAGASGNSYALNITTPVQVSLAQTAAYATTTAGWTDVGTRTYMSPIVTTATCSGACGEVASVSTRVSGMLFGANAEGLAAGISTSITGGEQTASVQAYKR